VAKFKKRAAVGSALLGTIIVGASLHKTEYFGEKNSPEPLRTSESKFISAEVPQNISVGINFPNTKLPENSSIESDSWKEQGESSDSSLPSDESIELSPLAQFFEGQSTRSDEEEIAYIEAHHNKIEQHVTSCMGNLGFEYQPESFLVDVAPNAQINGNTRADIAEYVLGSKPGYGYYESVEFALYINGPSEPTTQYDPRAPNALHLETMDEQMQDIWAENMFACNKEAFDEHGDFDVASRESQALPDGFDLNSELANIESRIDNDERVTVAWSTWSHCMAQSGFNFENENSIHDDLNSRLRMFDTVLSDGAMVLPANLQLELENLKNHEIAIRMADLNCRPPLDNVLASVRWEVETDFMAEFGLN